MKCLLIFQTSISFLVYDRDVNWQGQADDFMGSCNLEMTLVWNYVFVFCCPNNYRNVYRTIMRMSILIMVQ